jgi:hypothetical protein
VREPRESRWGGRGQKRTAPWLRYFVESDTSSVKLYARLEAVLDRSGLSILQVIALGTDVPCRTDPQRSAIDTSNASGVYSLLRVLQESRAGPIRARPWASVPFVTYAASTYDVSGRPRPCCPCGCSNRSRSSKSLTIALVVVTSVQNWLVGTPGSWAGVPSRMAPSRCIGQRNGKSAGPEIATIPRMRSADWPEIRFSHNEGWLAVSYTMTVDCPSSGEWFYPRKPP